MTDITEGVIRVITKRISTILKTVDLESFFMQIFVLSFIVDLIA